MGDGHGRLYADATRAHQGHVHDAAGEFVEWCPHTEAFAVSAPPGDGWIPWTRSDDGRLRLPSPHRDLREGESIENHYEMDGEVLVRAWSRKVPATTTEPEPYALL